MVANSETRAALRASLMEQGFTVFATGDSQVALDWLDARQADIVVSDMLLPGTRIAIPHVLRRRSRPSCPVLIGLAADGTVMTDEAERLLGFDVLLSAGAPSAVITRAALTQMEASAR